MSLFVVLISTLAPNFGTGDIPGQSYQLDKLVHFALYFFLGWHIIKTYSIEKSAGLLLSAAVMGLCIEVAQHYIPGRDMSIYDGIANTLGLVIVFYYMRSKIRKIV